MLPIGPMMIEHRIIERMIAIIENELNRLENKEEKVNPIFIDTAVDFIRIYADRTHHGKEEEILFRELRKKKLSKEHEDLMNELIEDHKIGRQTTAKLVKSKSDYLNGDLSKFQDILDCFTKLVDFYPKHIEKEDKHFFKPVMDYFSKPEQDAMLEEGRTFDRKMIHWKYNSIVEDIENTRNISKKNQSEKWLEFM